MRTRVLACLLSFFLTTLSIPYAAAQSEPPDVMYRVTSKIGATLLLVPGVDEQWHS